MIRYWFRFERIDRPHPINLGCGVTAHNYADALLMIETICSDLKLGAPLHVIENVSVSDLERNHVQPNIGNVLAGGI